MGGAGVASAPDVSSDPLGGAPGVVGVGRPGTDGLPAGDEAAALADGVVALGSAVYDPADHRGDERVAPVGLTIGRIGVDDVAVRGVGVEPSGEMEIPDADEIGWYRFGAAPGGAGTTVLAAHVAYDGVDGAFRRLADLQPGDRMTVALADGRSIAYSVESVDDYDKDELPESVFTDVGPARLALITCGGSFNPTLRSYDSNVVAWAVAEEVA